MPSTTITATTELQAVNQMLATIGEAPVNSLTGTLPLDASIGLSLLSETSREVQNQGWNFNTDLEVPLTRDGSGYIVIPDNCARVEFDPGRYDIAPVVRGVKLYDRKNRTFVFTQDLVARKMVTWLSFSDLPEPARRFVTIRASRIFVDRVLGDGATHQFTAQDEANAHRILRADFAETENLNFLSSPGMENILGR